MANKTFNTRVKNKRDTAANWEKVATTFQPLDGELIIVDTAAGKTRFKVGRYDTAKGRLLYYNEIPFTDEYLYNDLNESQGKIYDKLKGIDDKSIIEMTLEPAGGNGATELYKIGLWQFSQSGFYKIKFSVPATSTIILQGFARETGEDGTTNEDFSTDQLKIYSGLGGDSQTPYLFVLADYLDNDSFTSYHVQFLNLGSNLGRVYVNTYDKSTQKWSYVCRKIVEANKVSNALTLTKGDTTTKFDGSSAQTVSIPTKTSELTNDSDFTTQTDLDNLTNTVVSYNAQENITDAQKAQARTNIGAISSSDLVQASSTTFGLLKPNEQNSEEADLVGKYQQCYQLISSNENDNGTLITRSAVQCGQLTADFILNSCFWGDTNSDMTFLSASSDVKTTLGLVDDDFPVFGHFGGVTYSNEKPTYTIGIITQTGKHGTFTCKRSTGEMSAITWTCIPLDATFGQGFAQEIMNNFVMYTKEQSLTEDQKKNARDNISAMPSVIAGPNTLGGVKPQLGILIDEVDKLSVCVDSETGRLFIDGKQAKSIPIVDSFYNSTSKNDVFRYATSVACVATSMSVSGASFGSPDLTAPVLFLFGTGYRGEYPIFGIDSSGTTFDGVINTSNSNPSYQINSNSNVQADWNQNDETAKDYVKNRICYTKDATEITVLDSTLSFTEVSENDLTAYSYQDTSSNIKFNEGTTYIVNFDTTSYTCIAFTNASLSNAVILGNLGIAGMPSATNEPFAMITDSKGDQGLQIVTNLTGASHNVKIAENHTEIVKLDKKYIPDDIFTDIKNIDDKVEDLINNTQFLAKTDSVGTGSFSFNRETDSTVGEKSATFGLNNVASGKYAFAEGAINKATNFASHAEGNGTIASGNVSHAEGLSTKAIGATSHSEGLDTVASGDYSHAEGEGTTAEGKWSHTEGKSTNTKGWASHAEGNETVAQGNVSHAEGRFTVALGENQHVEGILNIEDTTSLHIVGNGTYTESSGQKTKSNAHTLDKLGNAWFAGDVYVGSTSGTNKDDGSKKLATEEYVDDQMTTINNQLGGLTGAMHFIGKAAVDITDGSTTDPQIANYTTKEKGDVILGKDDHKEFVWNGAIWEELGDEGSYALKTTTINGKALSDNITLTASDVGAASASTIETMQAAIDSKPSAADAVYTATAESTDGVAYTATVSGIDSLTIGASFIMIPNKASTSKAPTLNVNGLGAKPIRRRLSSLTTSLQQGYSTNWIALNKPFTVVYDGTAWVIEGLTKTDGADVYGAVAQATADAKGNNIADTYATIAMLQSLLPKVTTITLTSNWVGDASPYYQDIALSCVTETSIVDLQPTPEQLNSWQDDGLAFTTLSGNGTVRVYVAGGKPSSAISVQVRVQEVTVI